MEIRVNYEEVYSKTAELRHRIQSELNEMETAYRHANTALNTMDSSTNAVSRCLNISDTGTTHVGTSSMCYEGWKQRGK